LKKVVAVVAVISSYVALNGWMIVNNELERIWKEAAVVWCKLLFLHFLEGLRKIVMFLRVFGILAGIRTGPYP
jgi:hypothetical protein